MENRINVAELLKDCPTGMELDSTMFEKVTFVRVQMDRQFPIEIAINGIRSKYLTEEGCFHDRTLLPEAKCVIFPKGKNTWEGFTPPYEFKNGDVIVKNNFIAIISHIEPSGIIWYHCWYNTKYEDCKIKTDFGIGRINDGDEIHFATKEEKEKLFKVIEDNGYKWNEKINTFEKLIKPIFKKGDKVRVKNGVSEPRIIDEVCDRFYTLIPIGSIHFIDQHNWELVPNKIEPKFKVGDWITNGEYTWKVISVDGIDYTLQNQLGEYVYDTIDYVNKAFHLWTINDAKDGDVLFHSDSASNGIFIFKEILQRGTLQKVLCYCDYDSEDGFCLGENYTCCWADSKILYPATKERCDTLFQKMKEAGYKWNVETKTLVKLIEPKFKVGDKVRHKNNHGVVFTITSIEEDYYGCGIANPFCFDDQDDYELVPNKFDVNTLKRFDKVLIRDNNTARWDITFYELYDNENKPYPYRTLGGMIYKYCIPYEGNEHLCGKRDDCLDFYKTWE